MKGTKIKQDFDLSTLPRLISSILPRLTRNPIADRHASILFIASFAKTNSNYLP